MEKVASLKRIDYIYLKNTMRCVMVLSLGFLLSILVYHHSFATDVSIWDNDTNSWSTTFTDGDPIDLGTTNWAGLQQTAIDANGIVYIAYKQSDGSNPHVYLSRYDGTNVGIWDNDTASWTTTLSDGDPIDKGTADSVDDPQIAIDSGGTVYVTYAQNNGASRGLYLSRYDGTNVSIWDHDTTSWTTNFTDGDSIGPPSYTNMPQIAVDSNGIVYVTSLQDSHVYLSRYDGTEVSIWDHDTKSWTTTLADGDPIDTGGTNLSGAPIQMVIDPFNRVYITYEHYNGTNWHIYLSRYDGTDVGIWDNDTSDWTTTMANGDPIGTNNANGAWNPSIAVGPYGTVYVSYAQWDGVDSHMYLSRYDGTEVSIWDNDTASWSTTLADGDPIDNGNTTGSEDGRLQVDQNGVLYIVTHLTDGANFHVYLNRYDGTDVSIWDNDTASWSTTLADGDPIDINNGNEAQHPQLAIDSDGKVFISYYSRKGVNQLYINRYDGTEVSIWDNDTASWTTSLADGDPINTDTAGWPSSPNLSIGDDGTVFFTYQRSNGSNYHVYLSRCLNTITPTFLSIPTVTPIDGAVGIEIDTNISATFIENIAPATITTNTIYITGISGSVSYDVPTRTATFNPNPNLSYDTTYTATISTDVEDLDGNSLQADFTWSFTTGPAPDTTPPTIVSTTPIGGAINVPIDTFISAIFSEDMDALTIDTNTFSVDNGVTGTISYDIGTKTATFTPTANLTYNTTYTVTVTTGVKDLALNPLQAEYTWTFTTVPAPDTTPPVVESTSPDDNEADVPVDSVILVTFSENMDAATIDSNNLHLDNGASCSVSYDAGTRTATLTPLADLDEDTTYTITVTTGAKDMAGNALQADSTCSFTTISATVGNEDSGGSGGSGGSGDSGGCFINTMLK